jgi:fibro-slime domain-containing protein
MGCGSVGTSNPDASPFKLSPDSGGSCAANLTGVIRDFSSSHPDFEKVIADDRGIVQPLLGADFKPVYASATNTVTTTGKANFDQWYRDVPGVNFTSQFKIALTGDAYDNPEFFPIDNQGWGNEGQPHNYWFTFELHTTFVYKGGETFTFRGDDDLWTFINGHLAIDIGGVHPAESETVSLDDKAAEFGLALGKQYPLDIFTAERHTVASDIRIETSIAFDNCDAIIH